MKASPSNSNHEDIPDGPSVIADCAGNMCTNDFYSMGKIESIISPASMAPKPKVLSINLETIPTNIQIETTPRHVGEPITRENSSGAMAGDRTRSRNDEGVTRGES